MKTWRKLVASLDQRGQSLIILGAAFCMTAIIILWVVPNLTNFFFGRYSVGFGDGYDRIATNLAHGNGYRLEAGMAETMIREPGYPLFLAAVFLVAGDKNIEAARWANWLLMIGVAFMVLHLTRMVTNDKRTALIASLLFVFYPGTLISEAKAGVEILFIFVIFVFMLVLHWAVEKGALLHYFAAGVLFGAVLEVRGSPFLFPALLLLYLWLAAKGARERLRVAANIGLLVVGMAIVAAPWVIRNYALVHAFVPGGTVRGVVLQTGQFICRNLSLSNDYKVVLSESGSERAELARRLGLRVEDVRYTEPVFYDSKDEVAFSNALVESGMHEYLTHPDFFAESVVKNVFYFFFLGKTRLVTAMNVVVQLPLLILAVSGLYMLRKRGTLDRMGVMLTFVLSILAVHLPVNSEARYSVPVFAFLVIPAGVSIMSMWQRYRIWAQRWQK